MEIRIREIEERDYPDALKIWNSEISNGYRTGNYCFDKKL